MKLFNRNLFYAGLRFKQREPTAFRNKKSDRNHSVIFRNLNTNGISNNHLMYFEGSQGYELNTCLVLNHHVKLQPLKFTMRDVPIFPTQE